MPDSYKDLTHSAAQIDSAVDKANSAVQPTDLGTAATADATDFATAAQGTKADSAVQPEDLGTAALADATDFATASQGAKADTAVQPGDLGTAAAADASDFATASQGGKADTAVQPGDLGTAAAQNVEYFATAAQGGKADSAIQGLKVNSSSITPDSNKIVSITVPTSASDINALPNTTKYAAAIDLSINSSTYVMTVQLKDQNGDNIGSSDSIDLPLETMVVGGSYDSTNKKVILTLKNGETVEFSVADLVSGLQSELSTENKLNPAFIDYDSTHAAITEAQVAKIATNESNISKDEAALVEVIDDGAKNVLQIDEIGVSATHGQTYTTNGVTFTLNADYTVTAVRNAPSASNADCNLRFNGANFYVDSFCDGDHILSGCPSGGGVSTYFIRANRNDYSKADYGEGVLLDQTSEQNIYVTMRVTKDFDGTVTFKPMLCTKAAWDITHAYQPYALPNTKITPELIELVDSGAKNALDLTKATEVVKADELSYTLAADGTLTVTWSTDLSSSGKTIQFKGFPYKAGSYILSGAQLDGSSTAVRADVRRQDGTVIVMDYGQLHEPFELPSGIYNYVIRVQTLAGSATFKPMICSKAAWDVSHAYVPYRPSYEGLSESVEITELSINDIFMQVQGTLESNTKIWKQGNHIFGQIVLTGSFVSGMEVVTLLPDFTPAYEITGPCACIDSQSVDGYYTITDSNSLTPGSVTIYPSQNCTKISIPIDYVL